MPHLGMSFLHALSSSQPEKIVAPDIFTPHDTVTKNANILYRIDGITSDNLYHGVTSLSTTLWEEYTKKISIFSFKTMEEAKKFSKPLIYFSENENFLSVLFTNPNVSISGKFSGVVHVITEMVHMNMKSFIAYKKVELITIPRPWVAVCDEHFLNIFSVLVFGLRDILLDTTKNIQSGVISKVE